MRFGGFNHCTIFFGDSVVLSVQNKKFPGDKQFHKITFSKFLQQNKYSSGMWVIPPCYHMFCFAFIDNSLIH